MNLESELVKYLEAPSEVPFNISNVSTVTRAHVVPQTNKSSATSSTKSAANSLMPDAVAEVNDVTSDERIKKLNLGPLLNSSPSIDLTEKEVCAFSLLFLSFKVVNFIDFIFFSLDVFLSIYV